jgi:uncharacterized protein YneF (UPF0154 family)
MISSINDFLSLALIGIIVLAALFFVFRGFYIGRRKRLIEEEIEYYKEW